MTGSNNDMDTAARTPTAPTDEESRLTRRRAVVAGTMAGTALALGPLVVAGTAEAAATRGSLVVPRSRLRGRGTSGVLRAPHRFDLLGASTDAVRGLGVEVRARRRHGRWSRWFGLSDHDGHAPDGRRAGLSDPLWFGRVDEVEVRTRRAATSDLRLVLVAVGSGTRRNAAVATRRSVAAGGIAVEERASSRAAGSASSRAATQPAIIPRSAWAQGVKPKASPSRGSVQMAFVHHTVNGNAYTRDDSPALVRAIAEYHIKSNGWNDIGYNFLVDRFGQIFEGRAGGITEPIIGAQAVGWNSVSTGIAIIGTFESVAPPPAATAAVASLIAWKLPLHGAPTSGTFPLVSSGGGGNRYGAGRTVTFNRISGHKDGCSTDCPGTTLYGQLPALRAAVGSNPAAGGASAGLTLEVPGTPVGYGDPLTVSGRLTTAGGAAAGGQQVVVEKQSATGRWVAMGSTTTSASGAWSLTMTWRRAAKVRARSGGVTSKATTAGIVPKLSLSRPSRKVRAGRSARVRGTVRGVDKVQVEIQRKSGKAYRLSSRRTLKVRGGRVSGSVPVKRRGLARVRLRVRSGGKTTYSSVRSLRGV